MKKKMKKRGGTPCFLRNNAFVGIEYEFVDYARHSGRGNILERSTM